MKDPPKERVARMRRRPRVYPLVANATRAPLRPLASLSKSLCQGIEGATLRLYTPGRGSRLLQRAGTSPLHLIPNR